MWVNISCSYQTLDVFISICLLKISTFYIIPIRYYKSTKKCIFLTNLQMNQEIAPKLILKMTPNKYSKWHQINHKYSSICWSLLKHSEFITFLSFITSSLQKYTVFPRIRHLLAKLQSRISESSLGFWKWFMILNCACSWQSSTFSLSEPYLVWQFLPIFSMALSNYCSIC